MSDGKPVFLSQAVIDHLESMKNSFEESYDSVLRRHFEMPVRRGGKFQTKYPIAHLQIGEEVAWPFERKGHEVLNAKSMQDCIRQYSKKSGREFFSWGTPMALKVKRIA